MFLFQYDPFLTVVRCKRKKTKWRRGGAKKDTKWRYAEQLGCAFSITIYFSTNGPLFMLLWGANQRRRSCDMYAERRYVFSVVKYIIPFSVLLRYKRRRRSDGMWSNESMHFLLLLFNSRLSIGLITTFNSRILLPSNAHVEQWKQLPYSLVP